MFLMLDGFVINIIWKIIEGNKVDSREFLGRLSHFHSSSPDRLPLKNEVSGGWSQSEKARPCKVSQELGLIYLPGFLPTHLFEREGKMSLEQGLEMARCVEINIDNMVKMMPILAKHPLLEVVKVQIKDCIKELEHS